MPSLALACRLSAVSMALRRAFSPPQFSPASLFASGEQGLWYDPSDFSTLFQDAAGTIPVTAVEQPVGLILDKSGRGNHASQATTTARGVLRARYNLLTYSEDFSNPAWIRSNSVVSSNVVTAPNWDQTADAWAATATNNLHWFYSAPVSQDLVGKVKCVMHVKPNGYSMVQFGAYRAGMSRWAIQLFNLSTDEITTKYEAAGATVVSSKIENLADGWKRITLVVDAGPGIASVIVCPIPDGVSTAVLTPSYTGDGSSGIYVWGAELRPANLPASLPPYQRIAAATDYDTVGFPVYLDIDDADDSYVTSAINFTGTDKMTIWVGMRKLDDTARIFCELSADFNANIGSMSLITGNANASFYLAISRGSVGAAFNQAGRFTTGLYPAPDSAVITAQHDIAGDLSRIRRNGSSNGAIDGTGDKGAGNFGNYPLYLFSRGGTAVRWRGHFYGLIIRGAATETTQLEQTEQWINARMGGIY